jgi:hypothetical protein
MSKRAKEIIQLYKDNPGYVHPNAIRDADEKDVFEEMQRQADIIEARVAAQRIAETCRHEIPELKATIQTQQTEIATLKTELADVQKRMAKMEEVFDFIRGSSRCMDEFIAVVREKDTSKTNT